MKFSIATASSASAKRPADAWVAFAGENAKCGRSDIDSLLAAMREDGDFKGRKGTGISVYRPAGIAALRLIVAGLGDKADEVEPKVLKAAALKAAQLLIDSAAKSAEVWMPQGGRVADVAIVVGAIRECAYRYAATKSKKPDAVALGEVTLLVDAKSEKACHAALGTAEAVADGVELARELANMPGNHCTPSYLAKVARELGKSKVIKTEVLDRKQIEALGMGSFLSVTNGSAEPPRFIILRYNGAGRDKPHVLVGKGITFDTGGISLKPAAEMDEMKFDMGGAASVLGTFKALSRIRPKVNVVGLIPACENMPSGTATKPGDVVTSMSGQTIEILNTDAEGRLILCDALTYAERFEPKSVVDIATLTGACVIALGHVNTGLFTKDDRLAEALLKAGRDALDPCWRMPLEEEYDEALKTHFADVANVGGRAGGSITAACFLQRFATKLRWAHLDIAGTAWKSGAAKGATGRPVGLLTHYLLAQAG
jgi:leucyl aminopeptidase